MRSLIALLAGAASVFAFAPFELFPLALASLFVLFWLIAQSPWRQALRLGFAWGMGSFVAGVGWLFVALHRYGGLPSPLAALLLGLFCAFLALYPAFACALFARLRSGRHAWDALLFAACWSGAELLRGWLFTGFPWLTLGYTQTPPSPLAGWMPVAGVYGASFALALLASLLHAARQAPALRARIALAMLLILGGGEALRLVPWTRPDGAPLDVALVQPNIAQDQKWQTERLLHWLDHNYALATAQHARLVVLPETSLPLLADDLPQGYLEALSKNLAARGADLIVGVFTRDGQSIFNSAITLGSAPQQRYSKRHLVPFGEYSPPLFGWFFSLANIPMADQTRGAAHQAPLAIAGQQIAVNICYEDVFGEELIYALPRASMMLNLSNLAWYGNSHAQPQHLQIARVRALETGRPMLRATNTGMTAVVRPNGTVMEALPAFTVGVLSAQVQGYTGMTPYAYVGNVPVTLLASALVLAAWARLRRQRTAAAPAVEADSPDI